MYPDTDERYLHPAKVMESDCDEGLGRGEVGEAMVAEIHRCQEYLVVLPESDCRRSPVMSRGT